MYVPVCMPNNYDYALWQVLNEEPYSLYCDVFSYGMILYELLTFKEPFSDFSTMEAGARIRNGEVSQYLCSIFARCDGCLLCNVLSSETKCF